LRHETLHAYIERVRAVWTLEVAVVSEFERQVRRLGAFGHQESEVTAQHCRNRDAPHRTEAYLLIIPIAVSQSCNPFSVIENRLAGPLAYETGKQTHNTSTYTTSIPALLVTF
jgi:hypothetical protein